MKTASYSYQAFRRVGAKYMPLTTVGVVELGSRLLARKVFEQMTDCVRRCWPHENDILVVTKKLPKAK